MKILFLTSSYEPWHSPNSYCVSKLVEQLSNHTEVYVLAHRASVTCETVQDSDAVRWCGRKRSEGLKKFIELILFFLGRTSVNKTVCRDFGEGLQRLNFVPDVVVPVCFPLEAVIAAVNYKRKFGSSTKRPIVVPIFFDRFSASLTRHRLPILRNLRLGAHRRLEASLFRHCDSLFFTGRLLGSHVKEYPFIHKKSFEISLPLYEPDFVKSVRVVGEKPMFSVTYAGALHSKGRSGEFARKVTDKLCEQGLIKMTWVLSSPSRDFRKLKPVVNRIITGPVSKQKARELVNASMVNIIVGNSDIEQLPGKVFELLSNGAPIIYFVKDLNDPVFLDLKSVKRILFVVEGGSEEQAAKSIESWLMELNGVKDFVVSESELKLLDTYRPSTVARNLLKTLEFLNV